MICDPFSELDTLFILNNAKITNCELLIPWLALPPFWTTSCPTFPLRKPPFHLKIVLSRLECLTSTWSLFQLCLVEAMTTCARLEVLSKSLIWNKEAFDSYRVKWACRNYRLTSAYAETDIVPFFNLLVPDVSWKVLPQELFLKHILSHCSSTNFQSPLGVHPPELGHFP